MRRLLSLGSSRRCRASRSAQRDGSRQIRYTAAVAYALQGKAMQSVPPEWTSCSSMNAWRRILLTY